MGHFGKDSSDQRFKIAVEGLLQILNYRPSAHADPSRNVLSYRPKEQL